MVSLCITRTVYKLVKGIFALYQIKYCSQQRIQAASTDRFEAEKFNELKIIFPSSIRFFQL